MSTHRPAFAEYLIRHNGDVPVLSVLPRMLRTSFAAPSFRAFWHSWNPAFGYGLRFFCYTPVRRVLPAWLAIIGTFAVGGFLHDLVVWAAATALGFRFHFPIVTVAFILLGSLVVATDHYGVTLRRLSPPARAIAHASTIVCAFVIAFALTAAHVLHAAGA